MMSDYSFDHYVESLSGVELLGYADLIRSVNGKETKYIKIPKSSEGNLFKTKNLIRLFRIATLHASVIEKVVAKLPEAVVQNADSMIISITASAHYDDGANDPVVLMCSCTSLPSNSGSYYTTHENYLAYLFAPMRYVAHKHSLKDVFKVATIKDKKIQLCAGYSNYRTSNFREPEQVLKHCIDNLKELAQQVELFANTQTNQINQTNQ